MEAMNVDGSADTLGRWMAHFVAELIDEAERTTGPEKAAAQDRCFTAILELWSHRAKFPRGMRPQQELEPILRVVESLDLATEYPRYYPSAQPSENDPQSAEVEKWLDLARGLDYSAKLLIRYCLSQAADLETDKSKEWVKLAEAAEADAGVSEIFIRFISTTKDLGDDGKVNEGLRKDLEDRLQRLRAFRGLAEGLAEHFQAQLDDLPEVDISNDNEERIPIYSSPPLPNSIPE